MKNNSICKAKTNIIYYIPGFVSGKFVEIHLVTKLNYCICTVILTTSKTRGRSRFRFSRTRRKNTESSRSQKTQIGNKTEISRLPTEAVIFVH